MANAAADVAGLLSSLAGPAALLGGLAAFLGYRNAKAANNAVNHRKPGEKTAIELIVETHGMASRTDERLRGHLAQPASVAHPSGRSDDRSPR